MAAQAVLHLQISLHVFSGKSECEPSGRDVGEAPVNSRIH